MQVLSQEALDHIDSETLQKYMEACEKKRKEKPAGLIPTGFSYMMYGEATTVFPSSAL